MQSEPLNGKRRKKEAGVFSSNVETLHLARETVMLLGGKVKHKNLDLATEWIW